MKVKSSYLFLGAIAAPLLFSAPNIEAQQASLAPVGNYRREQRDARAMEGAKASEAKRDSKIAMGRVKNLCTPVVSVENGQAQALAEGSQATDQVSGLPLPEGGFVCTARGSTGEMVNGRVGSVRNVAREDMEEYLKFFQQQF